MKKLFPVKERYGEWRGYYLKKQGGHCLKLRAVEGIVVSLLELALQLQCASIRIPCSVASSKTEFQSPCATQVHSKCILHLEEQETGRVFQHDGCARKCIPTCNYSRRSFEMCSFWQADCEYCGLRFGCLKISRRCHKILCLKTYRQFVDVCRRCGAGSRW